MARHHTLGSIKHLATRIARSGLAGSSRLSRKAADLASARIAVRRRTPTVQAVVPSDSPSDSPAAGASARTAAAPEAPEARGGIPTPADIARIVARNPAGLSRVTPSLPRRRAPKVSAPGAKLPARAGQGILGV